MRYSKAKGKATNLKFYCQVMSDGTLSERVSEELQGNLFIALNSVASNETVMKLRCSTGLRCVS